MVLRFRFRTTMLVFGVVSVAAMAEACDEQGDGAQPKPLVEDERGSVGPGSPASIYCEKIGYKISGEVCVFPDGTSCEQWNFYRAICGQPYSYCNRNGGTIASREADAGGFTTVTAVCTVSGKECNEEDYYRSGKCN